MLQVEGTLPLFNTLIWLLVRKNLVKNAAMREEYKLSVHFFPPRWIHSANICCASPVCQELTVLAAGKTEQEAFSQPLLAPKTLKPTPMGLYCT